MPSAATSPEMLETAVAEKSDYLEIEAIAGFEQAKNLLDVDSGNIGAEGCTHLPGLRALVVSPPVFDGAVDGNAKFVVALQGFVGGAELALDHNRRSFDVAAEFFSGLPDHAVSVIAPIALHGAMFGDADDVEAAVAALDERVGAELDVVTEDGAFGPWPNGIAAAPPVRELAVLGSNDDFEISRRTIIALDEAGNAVNVVRPEDATVVPRSGALIEIPMMEAMVCGGVNDFEVAIEGGALHGG